ncbi:substrate-binding domain-containing protein [Parapedobacter lycopersici]|uniref:PstS family phosphate ABC transporter substrate-binding protein n=1 Tax=Parapedobacter lycopersici TaxID=1864939 RepID=UPI00333F4285
MKKSLLLLLIIGFGVFLDSCNGGPSKDDQTILTGRLRVLVDESLLPIMEEQVAVFEHIYDYAEVELVDGPENQLVGKLFNKEAEVIVLTRQFTDEEKKFFEAREFRPRIAQFATDAIALIANRNTPDSVMKVDDVIQILRGNRPAGSQTRLVFDNPNSSTVRFLKDLAGVDSLPGEGVYAMKSNSDVLKHVYETPQSIGVLGINWIVRPDSSLQRYVDGVKVLAIKGRTGEPGDNGYYKPTQSNLAEGLYPLSRPVYLINCEPRRGLGMGFSAFLSGLSGQRIILKSGLMPDSLPPREIIIR